MPEHVSDGMEAFFAEECAEAVPLCAEKGFGFGLQPFPPSQDLSQISLLEASLLILAVFIFIFFHGISEYCPPKSSLAILNGVLGSGLILKSGPPAPCLNL